MPTLFVVPTPIGNLGDLSSRAVEVLGDVDLVVAEDTRRTGGLMAKLGLKKPMLSLHEHNESARLDGVVARCAAGEQVALVSDAGTPALSDPGYPLVRAAIAGGLDVVVLPGPCAAITALVGSGLPTDRFLFAGFPPKKSGKRRTWMEQLAEERGTLVLYESPYRIGKILGELAEVLGGEREAAVARELTKLHEEYVRGTLSELADRYAGKTPKGEIVIVVGGAGKKGR